MIKKIIIVVGICMLLFACEKSTKPMETVATPVISPESGEYLIINTIHISCATQGAVIRYTLDGTDPTETSDMYNDDFELSIGATVKARAFKDKMIESEIASRTYTYRVSTISISPLSGIHNAPFNVSMNYITPGTTILYTLDGSEPDESSINYTGPVLINETTVVKAKGFIEGWLPSETRTMTYTFNTASPTLSVADGTYNTPFPVTISATTPEAEIRYTTDGSEPVVTSTLYTEPVNISVNTVLKAKSFKTNWNPSETVVGNYLLKTMTPTFTPVQGNYGQPQNVTIATATTGAVVYYSVDGTTPSESSTLYSESITLDGNTVLKAIALKTGWVNSAIATGNYYFNVSAPTFTPPGGEYTVFQMVAMTCTTPNTQIRYTTNNSDPNSTSTLYTVPVEIASTTTLKAKAYRTGWNSSPITSQNYTITQTQTVATPEINPTGGTYTVPQSIVITCATNSATIRYTTDNSEPTQASEEYTEPFSITNDTTIKAKAFRTGWFESQTATEVFLIDFTLGEMVSVPSGTFTMGRTTGAGNADELPTHDVTVSAFSIGKYEITQLEWQSVMGFNPSFFPGDLYRPVETVNWYAAVVYCNKRSILESFTPVYALNNDTNPDNWGAIPTIFDTTWNTMTCDWTANGYRLPTEAEWEYAARGATNSPDFIYSGSNTADEVAWYRTNSGGITQTIGHLMENGIGTYDMSGNVTEWCWDWYSSTYYTPDALTNPTGPNEGSYRISRGGYCDDHTAASVRVAIRVSKVPYYTSFSHGLRVVRANVRD